MKRTIFQSLFVAVLGLSTILVSAITSLAQPTVGVFPISRVSVANNGDEGDRSATNGALTTAGRYVAFHSYATNLIANDTNGTVDVFVRDTEQNTTTRVSVSTTGEEGDTYSYQPDISGNGRYVVFNSGATNFAAPDTNNTSDIFMRDRLSNTLTLISEGMAGGTANNGSQSPRITPGGDFVVFTSIATDILPNDTNGVWDCFIRDNTFGNFNRVLSSTGVELSEDCSNVDISAGAPIVVFHSTADNIVPNDTNETSDVFAVTILNTHMTRVSVNSAGEEANGYSSNAAVARDGAFVAFQSTATNLVSNDTNTVTDIFVHNTDTGETRRVSVNSQGIQANSSSADPHISDNGQYIVFSSVATNLVPNDTNGIKDIFIHDTQTGVTERLSTDNNGNESNADSAYAVLSGNGEHVAFESAASNLVPDDTNEEDDVFKVTVGEFPPTPTVTASPTVIPSTTPTGTITPVTVTPTVSPSPTINLTEFPATPTATGTPPTATPTPDPTEFPSTVTPTGTLVPMSTGTPMPTVTGTPPTATPTLDPTKFPPTVTPNATTVPLPHHLYLPLIEQ